MAPRVSCSASFYVLSEEALKSESRAPTPDLSLQLQTAPRFLHPIVPLKLMQGAGEKGKSLDKGRTSLLRTLLPVRGP